MKHIQRRGLSRSRSSSSSSFSSSSSSTTSDTWRDDGLDEILYKSLWNKSVMSDVRDQDLNDLLSQNPVFYTTKQENDVETCMKMLIHDERCPVAGANVCGLISTLCHTENGPASLFTQIFLRNFRTFCSPRNCLRSIIQNYEMAEDNAHRERILSILVVWVRDYWDMHRTLPF